MASLSTQTLSVGGTAPTYAAAGASGDTAPVGSGLVLHVKNDSAAAVTVTLVTPGAFKGLAVADAAPSVPAGGDVFVPLDVIYRDPTTKRAAVSYSATASVNVAVLQLP